MTGSEHEVPARQESRLPAVVRRQMEAIFGADFGTVRIHEGDVPLALGALACTSGDDIYIRTGLWEPTHPVGRFLLGHELAHVLQQRVGLSSGAGAATPGQPYIVVDDPALEREADLAGACAALGLRATGRWSRCAARAHPRTQAHTQAHAGARKLVQCVRFFFTSEIGDHYSTEETAIAIRKRAFAQLEDKLKAAKADLRAALVKRPAPRPGQPIPPMPPDLAAAIAKADADVAKFTAWLTLQDAVVDRDGNIDWTRSSENSQVAYDRDLAAQGLTKVRFAGGRLFLDDAHLQPLTTAGMVTMFSGPGKAIFVMSVEGNLHVTSHKVGLRHHSSLLAGQNVASAGELEAANGQLKWLSNKSGHYAPGIDHLLQVLHVLQKNGCAMDFRLAAFTTDEPFAVAMGIPFKATLSPTVKLHMKTYPVCETFLTDLDANDQENYEFKKLMAYQAQFDEARLNANGWRWRDLSRNERPGFYRIADNLPVPHSAVRKFLKAGGAAASVTVQRGTGR